MSHYENIQEDNKQNEKFQSLPNENVSPPLQQNDSIQTIKMGKEKSVINTNEVNRSKITIKSSQSQAQIPKDPTVMQGPRDSIQMTELPQNEDMTFHPIVEQNPEVEKQIKNLQHKKPEVPRDAEVEENLKKPTQELKEAMETDSQIRDLRTEFQSCFQDVEKVIGQKLQTMKETFVKDLDMFQDLNNRVKKGIDNSQRLYRKYRHAQRKLRDKLKKIDDQIQKANEIEQQLMEKQNKKRMQPLELNVGGTHTIMVSHKLLCSIKDSNLTKFFEDIPITSKKEKRQPIFIDRDGNAFQSMINYIRNNCSNLPHFDNTSEKQLFEDECQHWGIPIKQVETIQKSTHQTRNQSIDKQNFATKMGKVDQNKLNLSLESITSVKKSKIVQNSPKAVSPVPLKPAESKTVSKRYDRENSQEKQNQAQYNQVSLKKLKSNVPAVEQQSDDGDVLIQQTPNEENPYANAGENRRSSHPVQPVKQVSDMMPFQKQLHTELQESKQSIFQGRQRSQGSVDRSTNRNRPQSAFDQSQMPTNLVDILERQPTTDDFMMNGYYVGPTDNKNQPKTPEEFIRWQQLGALNVQEIIKKAESKGRFIDSELEVKTMACNAPGGGIKIYQGQVNARNLEEGIGRQIHMDSDGIFINEGEFRNGVLDGYARIICAQQNKDGDEEDYYLGFTRMGSYNGYGKLVYKSGEIEEGEWEVNEFLGAQRQQDEE